MPLREKKSRNSQAGFTTTNERQNENLFSFFSSAVGARLSSGNNGDNLTSDEGAKVNAQRAFTLIELIVALSIFTIVVTMVATGLFSVIDASARAQSLTESVNNLSFVVDDMARRIRTGYNFDCGDDADKNCENDGGNVFYFTRSQVDSGVSDPNTGYKFNGPEKSIERLDENGNWVDLTSEELNIEDLTFYVVGADEIVEKTGAVQQSRVLISITGSAGSGDTKETFTVQTSITQRLLYPPSS